MSYYMFSIIRYINRTDMIIFGVLRKYLPASHEDLVMIQETKSSYRDTIFVLGEIFANWTKPVKPVGAVGKCTDGASEDGVSRKKTKDTVKHDRSFGVFGRKMRRDLRCRHGRTVPGHDL